MIILKLLKLKQVQQDWLEPKILCLHQGSVQVQPEGPMFIHPCGQFLTDFGADQDSCNATVKEIPIHSSKEELE